jgi:hypothetical protein
MFRVKEHPANRGRPGGSPNGRLEIKRSTGAVGHYLPQKQGLPETIEDPGLLAALAQLVEEVTEQRWELPPKSA